MPPFRPANLNKRAYPGNASVIGPTRAATCCTSQTTCCSSTASCGACTFVDLALGCRCSCCHCPCCFHCCSCTETVCDRTVPSGRWKASEQSEASKRNSWPPIDTCSCTSPTCNCCTNVGFACTNTQTDFGGFFICCGPSTTKWIVSPIEAQVIRGWDDRSNAVTRAQQVTGVGGWFVPTNAQYINPGYCCRSYWGPSPCYCNCQYFSIEEHNCYRGSAVEFTNGTAATNGSNKGYAKPVRAFRCA